MTVMRVGGLASGMDMDAIIKDYMAAKRIPLDKLEQEKQILKWQQEDYRSLNSALFSFRDEVFDMKLQSAFNLKTAASSAEDVVNVTAGASTAEGTYSITVNSLASGVTKGSTAELAGAQDEEGNNRSLYEQFSEFGVRGFVETDTVSVAINGNELEFNLGEDTIFTVVSKINSAGLGVTASYDTNYNRFFLATNSTGSEAEITVSADEANLLAKGVNNSILGLNLDEGSDYNGQNASISIGDAANLESSSNTMTVNGLNLDLQAEGSSTVVVSRDVETIVESITGLIESYNSIMENLYTKIQEKKHYDYSPLTDAQKKEMSETEIELWEARAKSGILRGDSQLNTIVNKIRTAMSRVVGGVQGQYKTLSSIGISTRMWDDNGQLYIDETTLREALSEDPEGVKALFASSGEIDGNKGIANYLYDAVGFGITYLSNKAGQESSFITVDNSFIGNRLSRLDLEIEKWEQKLIESEDRYWRQFTYMEKVINQMNAQSAWLTQQFQ